MEKEFIPYAEALALKELGFDYDCFSYFRYDETQGSIGLYYSYDQPKDLYVLQPTFSQAFRFFREKYGLNAISPTRIYATDDYLCTIIDWNNWSQIHFPDGLSISYEEAELKCLKKLIEIVKEKQ